MDYAKILTKLYSWVGGHEYRKSTKSCKCTLCLTGQLSAITANVLREYRSGSHSRERLYFPKGC